MNSTDNTSLSLAELEERISSVKLGMSELGKWLKELEQARDIIKNVSLRKNLLLEDFLNSIKEKSPAGAKTEDLIEQSPDSVAAGLTEDEKSQVVELPEDIFKGVTAHRAIVLYLEHAGAGQTIREMSDALVIGGYVTKAKQLYDNIRPILTDNHYPDGTGDFININRKWELSKWHTEEFLQQFAK